ncbi:putative membrane protein [Xanthomonas arboricola]|uniref:sensor domain-containing protein n=1 Tax=Xanthomonas cannabis TaxID=1885674 RepID=UPI0015CBCFE2|nr:sensor domain-containing protein [Xanthomonas campestris pv. zinniae]
MNTVAQSHPLPTTISDYLAQLRQALAGADPAMIQDALYDAEEYLRAELAEQHGKSEAEVIAGVAGSYGAPEEVAEIYRETEVTVTRALRPPAPPKRASWIGNFFGVAADPRTYGALFYMLLSLLTGVFYFTWVVTGASLSIGLLILIIGVPLLVLFFGSVRVLSLVEGRVVETLLGVRMPRRPQHPGLQGSWLQRIGAMFTDVRTWSTMLYFVLMLPLGTLYFTVFCTLLSLSLGLAASPLVVLFDNTAVLTWDGVDITGSWLTLPLFAVGVLLLFVTLHLARAFGKLHGMFAKQLLVKSGETAA